MAKTKKQPADQYKLTEKQWETYKLASIHFESAKRNYVRNSPRWLTEQVVSIYEEVTGRTILNKNSNCAICTLNIYRAAGKLYFEELKKRENNNEEIPNRESITRDEEVHTGGDGSDPQGNTEE